jgi:hypothetical protein
MFTMRRCSRSIEMKTMCFNSKRTVFQVHPSLPVSLDDVHECLDASTNLTPNEKRQYLYCNGVDYDQVEKYYHVVMALNTQIAITSAKPCDEDCGQKMMEVFEIGRKFGLAVAILFFICIE